MKKNSLCVCLSVCIGVKRTSPAKHEKIDFTRFEDSLVVELDPLESPVYFLDQKNIDFSN